MIIEYPPLNKIVNEKFIPIFHNKDRYLLLWGGRGSSKSFFAAEKLIHDCLTLPYFRCILVRDTYASIKDSQYQTIKDIIIDRGFESLFSFREHPLEIRCINGNGFIARGCDDPAKIKSIKDPSHVWYEEPNKIKLSDFITITTSVRTTKAEYLQEILTFNPEFDGDIDDFWIWSMFFKGKTGNSFTSEIEIEMPDGTILKTKYTTHHSTYIDNKFVSGQFIAFLEQLRNIDPYYYDVFCLGIWGQKKAINPFATAYDKNKHESVNAVFDPKNQLIIGIDFNLNPFAVSFSHIWIDKFGYHYHTFDEAAIENGSVPAMIELIKLRYKNQLPNCRITGDSMGKRRDIGQADLSSHYNQLQKGLGLRNSQIDTPNNPTHKDSRADVNYVLYHFPDFKINPVKCPNTCRDFKSVQCDAFGQIIKKNRNDLTQLADHLDVQRYKINTFLWDWIQKHQKGKIK